MPVEMKPLTVKINNPDYVQSLAYNLHEMYKEMLSINVNNSPIKYHTKQRWEEQVREVRDFLVKFIPKEKLSDILKED